MSESVKHFAERLNQCLDEMDAPPSIKDRSIILSKMLDISKQQAWNLLEGLQFPSTEVLQKMADEFEVDVNWLKDGH